MRASHLSLADFRNYQAAEVAFAAGPNLVVGRNGQGKTNLVEALGFLSTLGSHRVSNDKALIRADRDAAIIRARIEFKTREILAEVQINRSAPNRAQVNRSAIKPRELPRYFSSVLFAPEDLSLIRGDPSGRRRFLDQLLVLRNPRISGVLADYARVLKQRNTLLKSARASRVAAHALTTLDIWDERLVEIGSQIIDERGRLVALLAEPLREAYQSVAGDDHGPELQSLLSILGESDGEDETASAVTEPVMSTAATSADSTGRATADIFRETLTERRPKELERALTLVGPHRDDVVFRLNSLPAKGYASHGETWSFVLALKLASAQLLRRDSATGDPVLILDDVFAELDRARRARLADAITGFEQVIITAAVLEDIPEALAAHIIHINAGTVI